jgi:hypothetical protein
MIYEYLIWIVVRVLDYTSCLDWLEIRLGQAVSQNLNITSYINALVAFYMFLKYCCVCFHNFFLCEYNQI